jgi:hypothetical protein
MTDVGVYVGWTTKDPKFRDFIIMKNVVEVPADMVWIPVQKVKKRQPEKR